MSNEDLKRLYDDPRISQPLFSTSVERRLLQLIHLECRGGRHVDKHHCEARTTFIERNMKLVLSCARRYVADGDPRLSDLVSSGTLGLIRGIDLFNVDKVGKNGQPFRFSTYGTWWVLSFIREELGFHDQRIVRHRSYHEQFRKARQEIIAMSGEADVPNITVFSYLRTICKWSESKLEKLVADMDRRLVPVESIAEPLVDDHPVARLLRNEASDLLNTALNQLPFEELYLLLQHYSADATYDEIAKTFGVSRERIRQIENGALRRLWELLHPTLLLG